MFDIYIILDIHLRIETQDMKVIYALLSKRTLTFSDVLSYVS